MIVTSIEQQKKNKERYSIFIDGEFAFGLIMDDILFFKIKEGQSIPDEKVDYIKNTVLYMKAQDRALNFLGYKKRTEKEMRRKLVELEYDEEIIERVIEFLKKYNYINDLDYAQSFIRQTKNLKPKGKREIISKLKLLGIATNLIEQALEEEDFDEFEGALNLLVKKIGDRKTVDFKEKKKLHDFLTRRGYSYDIIKDVFNYLEIKTENSAYYFD